MASLVFAGGSQFIAVAMIQAGASAVPVIATTFMVNLRHALGGTVIVGMAAFWRVERFS